MEMATARLSSTIGDGAVRASSSYSADQLVPVRLLGTEGAGVAGGDGRLERVRAAPVAERIRPGPARPRPG